MPTYEYFCTEGHAFECFQKMSDRPVAKCPTCGARASRKVSGGQGLIFKGSGFYITDYGKDGKGPRKTDAGGSESTTSTTSKPTDAPAPAATPAKAKPSAAAKGDS